MFGADSLERKNNRFGFFFFSNTIVKVLDSLMVSQGILISLIMRLIFDWDLIILKKFHSSLRVYYVRIKFKSSLTNSICIDNWIILVILCI